MNKQFLLLAGVPMIVHTLRLLQEELLINEILLVVGLDEVSWCQQEIVAGYGLTKIRSVLAGGKERQDSVYQGLQELSDDCQWVVVHDGARPLLLREVLQQTIREAQGYGAAVAAVPAKDTIKVAGPDGLVQTTLARHNLWNVQTPQVFQRGLLLEAYRKAYEEGFYGTDDASLVERLGCKVKLVASSYENLKITTPEDLDFAEAILRRRKREQK
jgi:2-C-methyl-D-erythritol 4-phosphate cytidylyltransferase